MIYTGESIGEFASGSEFARPRGHVSRPLFHQRAPHFRQGQGHPSRELCRIRGPGDRATQLHRIQRHG